MTEILLKYKNVKIEIVKAGCGLYSGLYIISELNIPFEDIKNILKSEEFAKYVSLLKKYKSGGYYTFNSKDVQQYINYYITYKSEKQYRGFAAMVENEGLADDDITEIMNQVLYGHKDKYREEIRNIFSNTKELFNHLMMMCQRKGMNHDIVWDIMGDDIIDVIPIQNPTVLIEDENGMEYLGQKYSLQEVRKDANIWWEKIC